MADFCKDCCAELFGGKPEEWAGGFGGIAPEGETISDICEGCGIVVVDHNGDVVRRLEQKEMK